MTDQIPEANAGELEAMECAGCEGSGKIVEEARTSGANQHSACQMDCDECDGQGRVSVTEDAAPRGKIGVGERVRDRKTGKSGSVQWVDGDKRSVVLVLFDDAAAHVVMSRDLERLS